jgi:pyruvate formate lyase activating enzyme
MRNSDKLRVAEIQRFCMHDGPGVRTTVFFKGCPLSCAWCHNPEMQSAQPQLLFYDKKCVGCRKCVEVCPNGAQLLSAQKIDRSKCKSCFECVKVCHAGALEKCGKSMTAQEILQEVKKDGAFYGKKGGVTLSGGEPLLQENAIELLRLCKQNGLSVAVETCGFVSRKVIDDAAKFVDLFLWDIKDTNALRHEKYTGVSNLPIIENLREVDSVGACTLLRCIIVSGVNDCEEHYLNIANIYKSLSHCVGVELLAYHTYGGAKSCFLGKDDNSNNEWIPSAEQMNFAKNFLTEHGVKIIE